MSLDAAIVIPAYKEGADIVHVLASVARQQGLENHAVGVFVVINNARAAAREAVASNAETARVVRSLQQGRVPEGLSQEKRKILYPDDASLHYGPAGDVVISQHEAAQQIVQRPFSLTEVNLWDDLHAPEVCNVGVARHEGTRHAISCLKNKDCAVLGTDADVIMGLHRTRNVIDIFERNPEVMAIRGALHIFQPRDFKNMNLMVASSLSRFKIIFDEIEETIYSLMTTGTCNFNLIESLKKGEVAGAKGPWTLDGSNMNFRARVYDDVQFQPLAGEEDTHFGEELIDRGYMVHDYGTQVSTATIHRFSDRAATGVAQQLSEEIVPYVATPDKLPLGGVESVQLRVALLKVLGTDYENALGDENAATRLVLRVKKHPSLAHFRLNTAHLDGLFTLLTEAEDPESFRYYLTGLCDLAKPLPLGRAFSEALTFLAKAQRQASPPEQQKIAQLIGVIKEEESRFGALKKLLGIMK